MDAAPNDDDGPAELAPTALALARLFRGRFCDVLLPDRPSRIYAKDTLLYEVGERDRTLHFLRQGVVKIGTITGSGREIIYDLRKEGDVVGELCALDALRRDRAVAVERTEAVSIPLVEVIETLGRHPALLGDFVAMFSAALADAHDQVNRLAHDDVMSRLVSVLQALAGKLGRRVGDRVEIAAYLTQEEVSQMVMARRERVCTALNTLRRRGIAQYSPRGHLIVDLHALDTFHANLG